MEVSPKNAQLVAQLLRDIFDSEEFKQALLRLPGDDGKRFLDAASSRTFLEQTDAIAQALAREYRIDREFFEWLLSERPRRGKDIRDVAAVVGLPSELVGRARQIRQILSLCYRRAVFTRFHAQLNVEAMFASMTEARAGLQKLVMSIEDPTVRREVVGLIAEFDAVERLRSPPGPPEAINATKLRLIAGLNRLGAIEGIDFPLPSGPLEDVFWTREDADSPPGEKR